MAKPVSSRSSADAFSSGRPLTIFGDGRQTRDYVHVADVASAIFRVATGTLPAPGGVNERSYNVGTGVATSVVDLANALLAAAGTTVPIEFVAKRPGELQDSCLNVDKAKRGARLGAAHVARRRSREYVRVVGGST